ncbi:MAG: arginine--tRNA ligase, partial [Clostridiales Family XIII bacterium]|nr:arginine--tRNA ligase [Clostridiales Family XIII bacterium]
MRDFKREFAEYIAAAAPVRDAGLSGEEIFGLIEQPADPAMGDLAFPCFRLAKALKKAPPLIAAEIAAGMAGDDIGALAAVGPYLNLHIDRAALAAETVREVLRLGARYGGSGEGQNKRVIVEYSSPNIAKPFHIGHIRSTVIGSAIGNILAFLGYEVVRINHLGDYGTQFGKLIVAYRRWGSRAEVEASPITTLLKYYVAFHKEAEQDPSLEEEARAAFAALERGEEEERELWQWFREESLKEFTVVYDLMGIRFDSFAGESFYSDKMARVLDELAAKGLLEASEGAQIVDLDRHEGGAGLGKALITKSDGSTLYITRDIAAAIYRKEHYGFAKNIYVVASQQDLHFKQWIKIVELMGYDWAKDCIHVPFGLVRLEDGAMSTRTGNVVFLEDVLRGAVDQTKNIIAEKGVVTDDIGRTAEEIGIGAVIFRELHDSRIKDYVFNWDKVLAFDGETGPYVQYSHARAASILRKA